MSKIKLIFLKKDFIKKGVLKNRKTVSAVLAVAAVIAGLIWIIIRFSSSGNINTKPLDAVPADAAMILEIKQPEDLWNELSVNSGVWRELMNIPVFEKINDEVYTLDSLFETCECVSPAISGNSVFISFHALADGSTGFVYLTEISDKCKDEAADLITKMATVKSASVQRSYMNATITEVTVPGKKEKFAYAFSKGVFICSFQPALIETAVRQQKNDISVSEDAGFTKVASTAGKKVNANIFINFNYFQQLFSSAAAKEYCKDIMEMARFAGWSALDISVKKDAILFNGFTVADSAVNFLNTFSTQTPHEIIMPEVLPSSTAAFVYYGFSNFENWYRQYDLYLQKKGKLKEHDGAIKNINRKYGTDIEKKFTKWIGNEMALVITEPADSDISASMFAVIKATDADDAHTQLGGKPSVITQKQTTKSVVKIKKQKKSKGKPKSKTVKKTVSVDVPVEVGGTKVYETEIPYMLPALFGKMFDGVEGKYYAVINGYVVFGNSVKALTSYIQEYSEEQTLNYNNNYTAFSKNISDRANIYVYSNIRKSLGIYLKYTNRDIYNFIGNNFTAFKNFGSFSGQFTVSGKLFYSNFCLSSNTTVIEESSALWAFKLDSSVYLSPRIITDITDKTKKIAAFDNAGKMYLIDKDGSLIWKTQLIEKPLSGVFVIDYSGNGKSQYMFNTPSYIYLLDSAGRNVENFPLKLPSASTAAMTVADFANDRDYRFIVPCGNKIFNFTGNGKVNPGWTVPVLNREIIKEVTSVKFDGNNCFAVSDKDGNICITDRRGIEKIKIKTAFKAAPHSGFYVTRDEKKAKDRILTTDTEGNLIFISQTGETEKKFVNKFSAAHHFLYEDVNGDKANEYIFLDNNKLCIYGADMKLLCSFTAPVDVSDVPYIYKEAAVNGSIGLVSSKAAKIFLVKPDCSINDGFPLNGSTPFAIKSLNNDGSLNLIVGYEGRIYNYAFE